MTAFWFLSDPARAGREKELIDRLCGEADWLHEARWRLDGAQIVVDLTLVVHGTTYEAVLTYPAHFPAAPISVRPRDAEDSWSIHQYSDGALCLEWGPDTWHEGVTGRQMVESLQRLLEIEQDPTEGAPRVAPSRHELSVGQALRATFLRFYCSDPLADELRRASPNATLCYSLHKQRRSYLVVAEAMESGNDRWENPDIPTPLRHGEDSARLFRAPVVQTSLSAHELSEIDTVDKLYAALNAGASEAGRPVIERGVSALVIAEDGTPQFYLVFDSDASLERATTVWSPSLGERRLSPEHDALAGKRVGIVGLGSVGSKVAVSLARTGVGSFYLVDDGVFLPENVVRNALDLSNTAELKADGVADLISRVGPNISVDVSRTRLSGQESNSSVARTLGRLASCDLVIDATANARVFNLTAAVAAANMVPLVWMEVFGGGIGGMLARFRPGRDPIPTRIRDAYNAFTAVHPAPEARAGSEYGAVDGDGRVLMANDADVGVIADHATRLAVDAMLEREPSMFPHSLYLVGLARAWVFEEPFHTIPIATPMDEAQALLDEPEDAAAKQVGLEFLAALLKETSGEDPSSA